VVAAKWHRRQSFGLTAKHPCGQGARRRLLK